MLTTEGRRAISAAADRHVGPQAVPGLVALVAHGGDVQVEVRGELTIGGPPVERGSLWRIASTTKPVTAVATLALAEAGLLDLDESVDRWLPELADRRVLRRVDGPLDDTVIANRAITTRDLLTFTFGLGMSADMFGPGEPWPITAALMELGTFGPPDPDLAPPPDEWIARLGRLPLMAQPGHRWLYNDGALVLSVLLSRAASMPFPEVLRRWVFQPLGMHDTTFWTGDTERLATAYRPAPDGLEVWDRPDGRWSRPPRFPDGAAGLLSTADDLHALARMLLAGGRPVLRAASVDAMTRPQTTPEQLDAAAPFLGDRRWAFLQAVTVAGPRAGSYGWDGGLGTSWLVDPVRDLEVIVMTQRMFESPLPPAVHSDIQDAAYAALPAG